MKHVNGGEREELLLSSPGRAEIYVRPFRGAGDKLPVSPGGGAQVRWRGDGKELFYIAPD